MRRMYARISITLITACFANIFVIFI